jgi:hypothetical protein
MKEWIQKQIDNDFADFKGLSVAAQIPMRDRLVNELLAEALRSAPDKSAPSGGGVDFRPFFKYVQKAAVHASDGVIALDVVIKV